MVLLVCAFLSQCGCSSTSSSYKSEENRFSFIYDNQEYSILSRSLITGNSLNYLLLREGNTFLLRARDNNLDGVLDTLLVGNLSLEQANRVYTHGLSLAVTEGKYKRSQPSRVYIETTVEGFHAIQSYEQSTSVWYNIFVIYNAVERTEMRILDQSADGILNQIETGEGDLEASQSLYEKILQEGIQAGQIVRINGSFVVELPS